MGKKGPVQALMLDLKNCSSEERPHLGKAINDLKDETHASHRRKSELGWQTGRWKSVLQKEAIDPTLPGRRHYLGRMHPVMQMMDRAIDILMGMGFSVRLGPEAETDYYNFEGAQFCCRSSGARHARHVLSQQGMAASDAHEQCASSYDGRVFSSDPHCCAGTQFSQ